jgi:hypothetical protein
METMMLNAKTFLTTLAVAGAAFTLPAYAGGGDWHRQTGGVPPPLQEEKLDTGAAPQSQGDEFYQRGTGGVAPQAHAE